MAANLIYRTATQVPPSTTQVKGSPLTHEEMDGNLKSLDAAIDDLAENLDGNLNFTTLASATLPAADADLLIIRQGSTNKKLPYSALRTEFAVDGKKDLFVAGTHYVKNVGTSVTLTSVPAKPNTVKVFFNGVYQNKDTYYLVGSTINFGVVGTPAVIDADSVEVQYEIPSQFVGLSPAEQAVLTAAQSNALASANAADASADAAAATVASLAASGGASFVGYQPAGAGAVATDVESKLRELVSVKDFGAVALTALNSAAVELATGGTLSLPKGTYSLTDNFTFAGQRLNIEGAGQNVSVISYSPASPGVAIAYNNPAAGGLYQGSIKMLGFSSGNSVDKTAISLHNTADCELHGIGIAAGAWLGTGSIGIRTYGRQTLSIRNCQIACARPIVFSQNPVFTSLSTDHYLVDHCELTTTLSTGSCIHFEGGVMHTNTTLRNLALTGGKNGIYWDDGGISVGASYALAIENIRTEQAADSTGWSVHLEVGVHTLQSLTIKNAMLDAGRNGILLRRAQNMTLENVRFTQTSGTQLDVAMIPGSRLILINCYFEDGGLKTIANGRCVRRSNTNSPTGHTIEEWVYDDTSDSGGEYTETHHHGVPVVVGDGGTLLLGSAATSTGFVFITSSEDVSAIYLLKGPTNSTVEVSDPDGFFNPIKNSASAYCVYYEAGYYYLQNNRGVAATVSVYKMLTNA